MTESWRPVVGADGYEISDLGRVRSSRAGRKQRLMSPYLNVFEKKETHYAIKLIIGGKPKTRLVHRLVAEAFLDNPENLGQVNHIDGNMLNNNANNLEWCDQSFNLLHARRILKKGNMVRVSCYTKRGEFIATYDSMTIAAEIHDTTKYSIYDYVNGRRKGSVLKGLVWKKA